MQEIRISLDPANARAIIRQYSGGHYDPKQPRDKDGKWTAEGHTGEAVKAATARKTALEGGKRGEAGRHHALQLAHEAAAAIKSGQGSSEHLGKLEAAVTALRIQHYQAGKRGESDDSVNEKKAVYNHFNGLLKGLKNAAAGKGEVPDVGAHGESKPDLTSAGSGASDTGVKNHVLKAGGMAEPTYAKSPLAKEAIELGKKLGVHTDERGFSDAEDGRALLSLAQAAEAGHDVGGKLASSRWSEARNALGGLYNAAHEARQRGRDERVSGEVRELAKRLHTDTDAKIKDAHAQLDASGRSHLLKEGYWGPNNAYIEGVHAQHDGTKGMLDRAAHDGVYDRFSGFGDQDYDSAAKNALRSGYRKAAQAIEAEGDGDRERSDKFGPSITSHAAAAGMHTEDYRAEKSGGDNDVRVAQIKAHEAAVAALAAHAQGSKAAQALADEARKHAQESGDVATIDHVNSSFSGAGLSKPDLTSADDGAMYGGVKNDLHTDQHVKIAQQRNFHQSWAARTSEEAHAGGRIVEADPHLRQLAYAHERVADGYNSLLKGSHMQFPEQAAHNAIARLNDLKGTPAEKTESYGAARRGAEALLERTKGERLKGFGQAAEDLNDEVLRPMMRGEAYNEDAYNASSSLQRALYQNESGGYSPDRAKDIQRHFNDAKTAFDRVPEGHPAKPVLKKALDQAGEFLSQHAAPQPRGDQSNHREHAVLAKLLRGHQATFNTGGTGVNAAASGHESVVKAAQAFGTPDMERHLANAEDAAKSASPDHAALIRGSVKRLRDAHAEWQKGGAANAEALRDHMDNLHEIAHGWDVNFDSPSAKAKGMATALNVQQAAAGGDKVTRRATLAHLKEKARAAGHLGEPMLKYVAEQEAALGNRDEGKAQQAKDALMQAHAIDPNMHKDVKEVYKRLTLAQRNAYDDVNTALLKVGQAHAHAAEGEHDVASAKMQEAQEHLAKVKPAMLAKLPTAVQQAHRAATEGLQA